MSNPYQYAPQETRRQHRNISWNKLIESGATPDEQAVYLYGMGIAHEEQGDPEGAINDYLSAAHLGNERAKCALMELQKIH